MKTVTIQQHQTKNKTTKTNKKSRVRWRYLRKISLIPLLRFQPKPWQQQVVMTKKHLIRLLLTGIRFEGFNSVIVVNQSIYFQERYYSILA